MLREFEGYEYPEIARLTGTSIPNIQVRLTRAKSMLREILMPTSKSVEAKIEQPQPQPTESKDKIKIKKVSSL